MTEAAGEIFVEDCTLCSLYWLPLQNTTVGKWRTCMALLTGLYSYQELLRMNCRLLTCTLILLLYNKDVILFLSDCIGKYLLTKPYAVQWS